MTPRVRDAALGLVVTLVLSAQIAFNPVAMRSSGTAYLWAIGLGCLMLARRCYPGLVLLTTVVGFFAYYAIGYPPIGVAVPVAAAVLSAAQAGRLLAAAVASAVVLAGSVTYRLLAGQDPRFVVGYDLPGHLLLLIAAAALGDSLRARRTLQEQATHIASLTAEQARQQAEQAAAALRLQTARDLHDSLGHSLAIISLHTSVAQEALPAIHDQAGASLKTVAVTTRKALGELRQTVTALRSPGQTRGVDHSLSDLDAALDAARRAGFRVSLEVKVAEPPATEVQDAIFRIVQEAVTNSVRHANGDRLQVEVSDSRATVRVRVADNGRGSTGDAVVGGHGITGMRERAQALGGRLDIRRSADGFVVEAAIPKRGAR